MKRIKITPPDTVHTTIQLPSSKSICNRALIINALGKGHFTLENLSDCDDTQVLIRALRDLAPTIDIMAAGTAMRFLTAFLSVTEGTHLITGTARMRQRPIQVLVDALKSLGAKIEYVEKEGFPPLRITGAQLTNRDITLPGSISSQYISALLMIGPILPYGLHLTLTGDIISRPYINLTLQLMHDFGAEAEWVSEYELEVKAQPYCARPYYIESDWSAASYWYEIAALSTQATIQRPGLFETSYQGDAKVSELFRMLGVETQFKGTFVTLTRTAPLIQRMEYNFVNQPDLAQTFVVTCALLDIPFNFSGLQSLKIKETDRIAALIAEMKKMGYLLKETDGAALAWEGTRIPADPSPIIDTYEDHRMAMAFAPAAIKLKELQINNPQVVSKSYPHYWEDLQVAGFHITEE